MVTDKRVGLRTKWREAAVCVWTIQQPTRAVAMPWGLLELTGLALAVLSAASVPARAGPAWTTWAQHTCTGAGVDLLREFSGTAGECKAKCEDLGPSCGGFVRIQPAPWFHARVGLEGMCFFRRVPVEQPVPNTWGDSRACFMRTNRYMPTGAAAANQSRPRVTAVAKLAPAQRRAAVVVYGLQHRDHGCAWPSQKRATVDVLERMGYSVDVLVVELTPGDGELVDGMRWSPGSRKNLATVHMPLSAAEVDRRVAEFCNSSVCKYLYCGRRGSGPRCYDKHSLHVNSLYTPGVTMHAVRQVYLEASAASLLRAAFAAVAYEVSVAFVLDVYMPGPIASSDFERVRRESGLVLVSNNQPSGMRTRHGRQQFFTNGLYVGKPEDVADVMDRFQPSYFPGYHDYEHQLKVQRGRVVPEACVPARAQGWLHARGAGRLGARATP